MFRSRKVKTEGLILKVRIKRFLAQESEKRLKILILRICQGLAVRVVGRKDSLWIKMNCPSLLALAFL